MDLPAKLKNLLRNEGFAALCVCGPAISVPRSFGDNAGGRPIKFRTTSVWEDHMTSELNCASPYWGQGLLFRIWTLGIGHARRIEKIACPEPETLRKGWLEMGPGFSPEFFEFELRSLADANGISTWSDLELANHLTQIYQSKERSRYARARMEVA